MVMNKYILSFSIFYFVGFIYCIIVFYYCIEDKGKKEKLKNFFLVILYF